MNQINVYDSHYRSMNICCFVTCAYCSADLRGWHDSNGEWLVMMGCGKYKRTVTAPDHMSEPRSSTRIAYTKQSLLDNQR